MFLIDVVAFLCSCIRAMLLYGQLDFPFVDIVQFYVEKADPNWLSATL